MRWVTACWVAAGVVLVAPLVVAKTTTNKGQKYVTECADAGVPTPPVWNYEDAFHNRNGTQWVRTGVLAEPFISENLTAEVFYYASTNPLGVCLALPRSRFNGRKPEDGPPDSIDLLGVICQGSATNKACFYDANPVIQATTTMRFGDGPRDQFFIGGADLLGERGGVCTKCHRGENIFIIHPKADAQTRTRVNSPLGFGLPNLVTGAWVDPIVVDNIDWPQNEGPTTLFPPDQKDGCLSCHNTVARTSDLSQFFGGRFPTVSSKTDDYCSILMKSVGKTMPLLGGLGGVQSFTALLQACMNLPVPDANPAQKMMAMEDKNLWSTSAGQLTLASGNQREGAFDLVVNASGYVRLDSVPFPTWFLPKVGTQLALDVFVPPSGQPQPFWLGAVQLYVTSGSANVWNAYVGQVELTPAGTGWRTTSFPLSPALQTLFKEQHADVRFGIAVNTPAGAPPVQLDALRFTGTLSTGPIGPMPGTVKENFERGGVWQSFDGAVTKTVNSAAVGGYNSTMAMRIDMNGSGAGSLWTTPSESPLPGSTITYRVFIPTGAPVSAIQPFIMDDAWVWFGSWNSSLPQGNWVTVTLKLPDAARMPLKQLGVKIYLSAPYAGPLYLDAIEW